MTTVSAPATRKARRSPYTPWPSRTSPKGQGAPARGDTLHQALLTGLLSRIGQWNPEQRHYTGAKQTRFLVHPSSALAKKPPAW
ncbi:oligonucleotide/oligosaccharide-binding fold domain-containing protein, partial [Archangium sp.]|uniref:oligonucleotide/oligosaccharide-binding fold domain-containing protein n=1 Tax=Archangium sp. TaxID=1872627 RepID=UPI002D29F907